LSFVLFHCTQIAYRNLKFELAYWHNFLDIPRWLQLAAPFINALSQETIEKLPARKNRYYIIFSMTYILLHACQPYYDYRVYQ